MHGGFLFRVGAVATVGYRASRVSSNFSFENSLSFLAPRGLNAYVYAPNDDVKHRADWRGPYDGAERSQFGELATHAHDNRARFGFAISPGLDITYESPTDRTALLQRGARVG